MKTEQPAIKKLFGNSTFREIHQWLRETLPPLGFQEEPGGDRGLYDEAKFKRSDVEVTFIYDKRENEYDLSAKAGPGEKGPIAGFVAWGPALFNPESRTETYQRFKNWLEEKPLQAVAPAESVPVEQTSSANPLGNSRKLSALQAHELTLSIGKVVGFTEEDLNANRNGEFPLEQRQKILLKNWWVVLIMALAAAYTLWMVIPMWLPSPAFIDGAVCFSVLNFGLLFFVLSVLYISAYGARGVFAALLGRKIEQGEGIALLSSGESGFGKSRRAYHTLTIPKAIFWEIPERIYNVLETGLCYHIYYVPRTRYLLSLEVLPQG
jgi:hypothetical protein